MPITILLADDHSILRESLRRTLESHQDLTVIGEAADGAEAVRLAEQWHPDVAVVDIGMKKMNGLEATARIANCSPETAVLILTVYSDERYVTRALRSGARGYLLKESLEDEELLEAIRTLHEGRRYFSTAIAKAVQAAKPAAGS